MVASDFIFGKKNDILNAHFDILENLIDLTRGNIVVMTSSTYLCNTNIPYDHEKLPEWRNAFKGIQWHDKETNFLLFGGIDDVWINTDDELHIVDYKATAKKTFNPNFDTGWEVCYKRQIEIYQWLFRKNGFKVSDIGSVSYTHLTLPTTPYV